MNANKLLAILFLIIPSVYAQNSIATTLSRTFTQLHQILSIDIIKWGLGVVALGIIFYGIYAAILVKIPMFSAGEKLNTQGNLVATGLLITTITAIYASEKMGALTGLQGMNLLFPGLAVAGLMIWKINSNFSKSNNNYLSEHSRTIAMILTALFMFFLSGFMNSPELISVGLIIVLFALILMGLSGKLEEHREEKMHTSEHYREKEDKRKTKEEKKVKTEQKDELAREAEMSKIEQNLQEIKARKNEEIKKSAEQENDEEEIIKKIYSYLNILYKNEANIKKGDSIVARGYTQYVPRVQKLKQAKQEYKEAVKFQLTRLNEILIEEVNLNEKEKTFTDEENEIIKQEFEEVREQLKGERKDIALERKELKQTVEESEKAIDRGEMVLIKKEEALENEILKELMRKKYAAKKIEDLEKKYGKALKFEKEHIIEIQRYVDMDDFSRAAKELRNLLKEVRKEEKELHEIAELEKQKSEESERIAKERQEAEDLMKKEEKTSKRDIKV